MSPFFFNDVVVKEGLRWSWVLFVWCNKICVKVIEQGGEMFAVFLTELVIGMGAYFYGFDKVIVAEGAEVLGNSGGGEWDKSS